MIDHFLTAITDHFRTGGLAPEKIAAGVLLTLACLWLVSRKTTYTLSPWAFRVGVVVSLLCMRLFGFFLFFVARGAIRVSGDVPEYYYPQALAALAGLIPYRDFPCNYGPLFPYLSAIPVSVWDSPWSIVLFGILIETASAIVWLAVAGRLMEERAIRVASLLYVTSLLPISNVGISGQNQVWVSLFLGVSAYLIVRGRDTLSGVALAMAAIAVKFLALLFTPALFFSANRRLRWSVGFGLVIFVAAAVLWLFGADILFPLGRELPKGSCGNIPYVMTGAGFRLSGVFPKVAWYVGLALLICVACALHGKRSRSDEAVDPITPIALSYLLFALLSPKSYSYYAMLCFFPICLCASATMRNRLGVVLFGLFGVLLVVEPNLWQSQFNRNDLSALWADQWPRRVSSFGAWAFIIAEASLLSAYVYYIVKLVTNGNGCGSGNRIARLAGAGEGGATTRP